MTWVSTTVIACIQQVPQGDAEGSAEGEALEVKEISATAEDYLSAVDEVHARVPEGWRVLYVRSQDTPVTEAAPAPPEAQHGEHDPNVTDASQGAPVEAAPSTT